MFQRYDGIVRHTLASSFDLDLLNPRLTGFWRVECGILSMLFTMITAGYCILAQNACVPEHKMIRTFRSTTCYGSRGFGDDGNWLSLHKHTGADMIDQDVFQYNMQYPFPAPGFHRTYTTPD